MRAKVIHGDALDVLSKGKPNSVDAIVTDPPAGISFMGKEWDSDKGGSEAWIAWLTEIMVEALRVLKPGGHAFVWAIPRTSHWTATALERAGFEIRDKQYHIFGSGFPKAHVWETPTEADYQRNPRLAQEDAEMVEAGFAGFANGGVKPAVEEWILARKPIEAKSVAANVLEYGTGALNIAACRIAGKHSYIPRLTANANLNDDNWQRVGEKAETVEADGRFPANLILSHAPGCRLVGEATECADGCAVAALDRQSGESKGVTRINDKEEFSGGVHSGYQRKNKSMFTHSIPGGVRTFGDAGGASRFFTTLEAEPFLYCAKPSKAEKNAGLEGMPKAVAQRYGLTAGGNSPKQTPHKHTPQANSHPTVKPVKLMRHLIKLITPPNGVVLDMFCGSGTTGVGAIEEGFRFVGIDADAHNVEISTARIAHAESKQAEAAA